MLLLGVMYIHMAAGQWINAKAGQPKDNEEDEISPRHFGRGGGNGNGEVRDQEFEENEAGPLEDYEGDDGNRKRNGFISYT